MASARRSAHLDMPDALAIEQNNATGQVIFWQREANQSEADSRGVSLSYYIHALYGLLRQAGSRNVLMIGCGGGTLATMLHRAKVRCTIVDIDPRAFDISHKYFHMPDEIECHVEDGAAFLRRAEERYDAIVLDAYTDGAIPKQFAAPSFFKLAKERLDVRRGVFLANMWLTEKDSPLLRSVTRLVRSAWQSDVRILDEADCADRNAIITAGNVRALKRPHLLMRPRQNATEIAGELKALQFQDEIDLT